MYGIKCTDLKKIIKTLGVYFSYNEKLQAQKK